MSPIRYTLEICEGSEKVIPFKKAKRFRELFKLPRFHCECGRWVATTTNFAYINDNNEYVYTVRKHTK